MKFDFMELLYLLAMTFRPLNDHSKKEKYIKNFVVAFYDSEALDSWLKIQNLKDETIKNSLKPIIKNIRDIFLEFKVYDLKRFITSIFEDSSIMTADQNHICDIDSVGLEYFVMIRSIIRILRNNGIDKQKRSRQFYKSTSCQRYIPETEIIFEEFNLLYLDFCNASLEFLKSPKINESNDNNNENNMLPQNWLENVFPKEKKVLNYVLTSSKEIALSRKSLHSEINLYLRNEYTLFSSNVEHNYELPKIETDKKKLRKISILKFKHKQSSAKFCLLLIHISSILNSEEIIYRIERLDDDFYEIECSSPLRFSLEDIKKYYKGKNYENDGKVIFFNVFTLMDGSKDSYSCINDEETENEPINDRVIGLSCRHLLGLSLIDDFFNYCYNKPDKDLICPICGIRVEILGSFESTFYKRK